MEPIQTCKRCVYTSETPNIEFDEEGICNYCKLHDSMDMEYPTGKEGKEILKAKADEMRSTKSEYDCIVGVSGGCDSSFMLHNLVELGLNPLAVTLDNGWGMKVASDNVEKVTNALKVDLETIRFPEYNFLDMTRAFMRAGVPEADAPSDIAIYGVLYRAAAKYGVKYILDGHSFRTEGTSPGGWFYFDGRYVQDVHSKFGSLEWPDFPNLSLDLWLEWMLVDKIKRFRPLYHVTYDKANVKKMLHEKYDWNPYEGFHAENLLTHFFINYWLPKKFNIDLRRVTHSAMVRSGQMDRDSALKDLSNPPPITQETLNEVCKRLGFDREELEELIMSPNRSSNDFKTYKPIFHKMGSFFMEMYNKGLVPRTFYEKYCK